MIYIFSVFMLLTGYYCLTYGISLWKDDRNKFGSVGVVVASILGTVVPLVVMFLKR